jgi:hypothetical protein
MRDVEFVRLYDDISVSFIPWKFLVEDNDWWPRKWLLYPIGEGDFWLVKRESPYNEYAKEDFEWIGIKICGELVFKTKEWNNQVLQIWKREDVLAIFEEVRRKKFSGVVLKENLSKEEREEIEKMLRWLWIVRLLLEDRERISAYGPITFGRYIERYYSQWSEEFRNFFEKLAKLEGKERIEYLMALMRNLNQRLFETGYFMHVYYP